MISPRLASESGCHSWGNVTGIRMLGERIDSPRCDNLSFTIMSDVFKPLETIVYDLGIIAGKEAKPLDGAIGLDIFADKVVTIRLAHHQLIIETPETLAKRQQAGMEIPLRIVRDAEGAALSVDIGVQTSGGLAWMELDTGNTGPTAFVSQAIAPLLGLDGSPTAPGDARRQKVTFSLGHGIRMSGEARVFPGMIMDGNIGAQFLRNWDITLDLRAGRAWLAASSP